MADFSFYSTLLTGALINDNIIVFSCVVKHYLSKVLYSTVALELSIIKNS